MTGSLTINGKDAFTTWGITFDTSALAAIMTPPPMKDNPKSSPRLQHGSTAVTTTPRMEARQMTLTFSLQATSEEQFIIKYNSFCQELQTGFLVVWTKYQPNVWYHLEYNSCSQFSEYRRTLAKFSLKCTENRPDIRTEPSTN